MTITPIPLNDNVVKSMKSNRRKDTTPEILLRTMLREIGYPGYRLQWNVPGRPDIAYPGRKIAIYVNGCFWHRCPKCNLPLPNNNQDFWKNKFEKNIQRDKKKADELKLLGWRVITVWECEIKNNSDEIMKEIVSTLMHENEDK